MADKHKHAAAGPNGHKGHGYGPAKADILKRLRRIEGQVRGLHSMVEQDRYCVDILTQISAAKAGLDRVGMILLERHTQGCVKDAIAHGQGDAAVQELLDVIKRFV